MKWNSNKFLKNPDGGRCNITPRNNMIEKN